MVAVEAAEDFKKVFCLLVVNVFSVALRWLFAHLMRR